MRAGMIVDPSTLQPTAEPAALDPLSLTRHAVVTGMTGSGKTGMCVTLLEQLGQLGVPMLVIDPKGDMSNLALIPASLTAAAYAPWVEGDAAAAAQRAAAGLAADGRGEVELRRYREAVGVTVLTPGSDACVPVDALHALCEAPEGLRGDAEGLREYVTGAVGALLGLVGRGADPLNDPAAILLARLIGDAFARGEAMPLDALIPAVVDPPFQHLGYLPLETFLPRPERVELAKDLNKIVASPAFAAWRRGVPLDVGAWLERGPRAPVTVLYLAHLDDAQRMFFVALLLTAVVAWSRRQPGTGALRALLYFDEVMGYLPPHPANPPSKAAVLTLMKQARAVGLGVMLCTQNPMDVDYKAMSNAGTWLVGRLMTRNDRARIIEGLQDPSLADTLAALPPRTFLLRDEAGVRLVRSSQAFSILRGPLTRPELGRLGQTWTRPEAPSDGLLAAPPAMPGRLSSRWLDPDGWSVVGAGDGAAAPDVEVGAPVVYTPWIYARFEVRFADELRVVHRLARAGEDVATPAALADPWLHRAAPGAGRYPPALPGLPDARALAEWTERWGADVARVERGADGRIPRRADVTTLGVLVVWAPRVERIAAPG